MQVADHGEIGRLSKILFGQVHRLNVMVAIAESDGLVNPTDLAETLGFAAQSAVQAPLRDLVQAGLIARLPGSGAGRTYYQRQQSLVWQWVIEFRERALAGSQGELIARK